MRKCYFKGLTKLHLTQRNFIEGNKEQRQYYPHHHSSRSGCPSANSTHTNINIATSSKQQIAEEGLEGKVRRKASKRGRDKRHDLNKL